MKDLRGAKVDITSELLLQMLELKGVQLKHVEWDPIRGGGVLSLYLEQTLLGPPSVQGRPLGLERIGEDQTWKLIRLEYVVKNGSLA